jgi:hypothetical protein
MECSLKREISVVNTMKTSSEQNLPDSELFKPIFQLTAGGQAAVL